MQHAIMRMTAGASVHTVRSGASHRHFADGRAAVSLLAFIVRRTKSHFLERSIALSISRAAPDQLRRLSHRRAALRRTQSGKRRLPMQLCDWAMFVIIVALWTGNRRWLEDRLFLGNRRDATGASSRPTCIWFS